MTINSESIRDAAAVLDTVTSQLPDDHPLVLDANGRAKGCVTALYSAADQIDAQAGEVERLREALQREAVRRLGDIFRDEKAAWDIERAKHDVALDEVMHERDEYHDIADKLTQAIADHLLVGIGEHSSANCPWMRALEEIQNASCAQQGGQS